MYQFFERGIRGGQSVISKKYAKANKKYLSNYNPDENLIEKSTYISYLEANSLYGVSMSCKLLFGCTDLLAEPGILRTRAGA